MATPNVNRFWVLRAHPVGDVKPTDISLETGPIPVPTEGQVLVKNIYVSIDPTHRVWMKDVPGYMPNIKIGEHLRAVTLGEVIESKSELYKKGDYVTGMSAVEDYFTADATTLAPVFDTTNLTANLSVYALLQGFTAWAGMNICAIQKGDTFVVSAAAGAVGSIAGQLAKARGARTIGIVGSQAKADWIINDLGFDAAINYKTEDVSKRLAELAPNGVNAYYENVGGKILDAVLENLADFSRIALCGMIAGYNEGPEPIKNLENLLL
eukprot:Ihof_evm8s211 gene=Ihof_evmTU8s211